MNLKLRTATSLDIDRICQLVNSAYRGDYSKQGWTTEAGLLDGQRTDPKTLREDLMTPGHSMELLLDEEETLLGCVYLRDEAPESLYFGMLTVEPTRQGGGFGKILLDHIEAIAKTKKKKVIRMTVIDQRAELIAFYRRRGFEFTGHVEPFPMDDPKFGIPKQRLELLVFEKKILTGSA